MAKKNCSVCGAEFEPCRSCNDKTSDNTQWRRVVCCPEHFSFHITLIDYIRKKISKQQAADELKEAIRKYGDVKFTDSMKPIVAEILSGTNKTVAVKTEESEPDIPESKTEEVIKTASEKRKIRYAKSDD